MSQLELRLYSVHGQDHRVVTETYPWLMEFKWLLQPYPLDRSNPTRANDKNLQQKLVVE